MDVYVRQLRMTPLPGVAFTPMSVFTLSTLMICWDKLSVELRPYRKRKNLKKRVGAPVIVIIFTLHDAQISSGGKNNVSDFLSRPLP